MESAAGLVAEFGFPVVMAVGMGYFIFYIWQFISNNIQPEIDAMHLALIKCIDQNRMLDNDMIRLQQKVKVVLEYREKDKMQEEIQEQAEKISNEKALSGERQNENK
ncbi:MAG: hypothetical protein CMI76_04440 [Candidatus Pelagibacter sp.]|nr:hypothetical protein [Candidatus Pelagibacter sp.]MAJ66512.1 hypothetical protein [Candidatus Pelagibacter sp.]OUW69979.1 MAG: hypothetical protein CBD71_04675 [Rickettsiales bacterium TMED211]